MLDLVFRNSTKGKTPNRAFFVLVLETAIHVLGLRGDIGVSVNLVGPAKIKSLNKKYRKKDKSTDVLSFPLADVPIKPYNTARDADLGDLFLCPSYCAGKASEIGVLSRDYMAWATVHGFLHLCGYDHEKSKSEENKMFRLEKRILQELGLHNAKIKNQNGK